MKLLRTISAIAMLIPLASLAAHFEPADGDRSVIAVGEAADPATGYDCCWVFMMGQWWCVPC